MLFFALPGLLPFFPWHVFYFKTLSTYPQSLTFPIPKAFFECFLSLILYKGKLRPSSGTIEPGSRHIVLQLLPPNPFSFNRHLLPSY